MLLPLLRNLLKIVAASALLLTLTIQGWGFQLPDSPQIHGFVSQGYIRSSANNYIVYNSREGSAEFNEAAIGVTSLISDRLRIGLQLFAKDLGNEGNHQVYLDWAYGDFRWKDYLGFRAGKLKMPVGFYNQYRDLDMVRTSVLLPQGVYSERMRDFILAYEGASIYGNINLKAGGDLDYELFGGTLNVPDPGVGFWQSALELEFHSGDTPVTLMDQYHETLDVQFEYATGGAFTWNTPLEGLRLGTTWMVADFETLFRYTAHFFTGDSIASDLSNLHSFGFTDHYTGLINRYLVYSLEYNRGPWTFAAELLSSRIEIQTPPDTFVNEEEGYYFMLNRQVGDRVSVGGYSSSFFIDARDQAGTQLAAEGYPDYFRWQRDWAAYAMVNITDSWLIKGEVHWMDGAAQLLLVDLTESPRRYWNLYTIKTTFHF